VALADADPQGPRFSEYNSFLVFHAGVGHETGELNDIRSVYLSPADLERYLDQPLRAEGTLIPDAWILPEAVSTRGQAGLIGLLAKFFGHQLGLPGLSNFADGLPAMGGWSLMDVGANRLGYVLQGDSLQAVFGFAPPHPEAWSKAQLGWISPLELRRDTVVAMVAADRQSSLPKALRLPLAGGEYLLLENRQQRGRRGLPAGVRAPYQDEEAVWLDSSQFQVEEGVWTGMDEYDAFVPGSGILIWHVDERVIAEKGAAGQLNDDPLAPGIFLHEADGHRDIGNPIFDRLDQIEGSPQDPFYLGGETLFSSSRSNTGLDSGIEVEVLSPPGDTMLVRVSFAQPARGWPQKVGAGQRLQGADLDGDGKAEMLVQTDAGIQVAKAESGILWAIPGAKLLAAGEVDGDGRAEIFAARGNEVSRWKLGATTPVWEREVEMAPANGLLVREEVPLFDAPFLALLGGGRVELLGASDGDLKLNLKLDPGSPGGLSMIYTPLKDHGPALVFPQANTVLTGGGDMVSEVNLTGQTPADLAQASLPAVAGDLDGDGRAEVVVAWPQGRVAVIGERSWQRELGDSLRAGPALGDVDGDGFLEVVVAAKTAVHVLRADGTQQADFPVLLPRSQRAGSLEASPILLDLDGGGQEIFVGAENGVYGISARGEVLEGFPLLTGEGMRSSLLGLDLDGDGELELAGLAGEYLYMWDPGDWAAPYRGRLAGWSQEGAGAEGTRAYAAARQLPRPDPAAPLLPEGQVYCYPNPVARGEEAHLRFWLGQPARVELEVFDPLGARLTHLRAEGGLAQNELRWPVDAYPSGLYLCRLEARAADGTKSAAVVKMAVGK
jgi:M6 family metalloprotease-like protein